MHSLNDLKLPRVCWLLLKLKMKLQLNNFCKYFDVFFVVMNNIVYSWKYINKLFIEIPLTMLNEYSIFLRKLLFDIIVIIIII